MRPIRAVAAVVALLAAAPARAEYPVIPAEPIELDECSFAVIDPIVTPVRDVDLDAQRSACLRQELSARLLGHALIDTPGFHGMLGGDLALGARFLVRHDLELSAQLRVVDYAFVQNAVNKVTDAGFGPLVVGAAYGAGIARGAYGALVAQLELPYTRDNMDTLRTSGALSAVITGQLARAFVLHARLGVLAMYRESVAGSQDWLALHAGSDVAWHLRARLALVAGADISAGWAGGLDYVMVRAGVHWQVKRTDWRLRGGVGVPLGGSEKTNAVLDLALVHGI